MAVESLVSIPIIIGLLGVVIAVLERGYKTFLEKKVTEPDLKFNSAYLLNILISGGTIATLIISVLPLVLTEINANEVVTLGSAILVFVVGYGSTYRVLDGFNNRTELKIEAQEAQAQLEE